MDWLDEQEEWEWEGEDWFWQDDMPTVSSVAWMLDPASEL